jgi:hypothetical protein
VCLVLVRIEAGVQHGVCCLVQQYDQRLAARGLNPGSHSDVWQSRAGGRLAAWAVVRVFVPGMRPAC